MREDVFQQRIHIRHWKDVAHTLKPHALRVRQDRDEFPAMLDGDELIRRAVHGLLHKPRPAVDLGHFAGDETGQIGREEEHGSSYII
jgi:hypothetical protein